MIIVSPSLPPLKPAVELTTRRPTLDDVRPIGHLWYDAVEATLWRAISLSDSGTEWVGIPIMGSISASPTEDAVRLAQPVSVEFAHLKQGYPAQASISIFGGFCLLTALSNLPDVQNQTLFTLWNYGTSVESSPIKILTVNLKDGVGQGKITIYDENGNEVEAKTFTFPNTITSPSVIVFKAILDETQKVSGFKYNIAYFDASAKTIKTVYASPLSVSFDNSVDLSAVQSIEFFANQQSDFLQADEVFLTQLFTIDFPDEFVETLVQAMLSRIYPNEFNELIGMLGG